MTAERHVAAARRLTSERWQRPNDRRQGAPWMSRAFGYARKRLLSVDAMSGFPPRGYRKYDAGRAPSSAKAIFAETSGEAERGRLALSYCAAR